MKDFYACMKLVHGEFITVGSFSRVMIFLGLACSANVLADEGASQETYLAAASDEQTQLQETQDKLIKAKAVIAKAEEAAVEIIRAAEMEAEAIINRAGVESENPKSTPLAIKNEEVAVELHGATVEEIANALMPQGWRVLVDVKKSEIKGKRFQYISTKSRDQALIGLTKPLDLNYRYFFNLKDEAGESSPLLVISDS